MLLLKEKKSVVGGPSLGRRECPKAREERREKGTKVFVSGGRIQLLNHVGYDKKAHIGSTLISQSSTRDFCATLECYIDIYRQKLHLNTTKDLS